MDGAIRVDFDGTLCVYDFPNIGQPRTKMIQLINRLANDHKIIVWTGRRKEDVPEVEKWLISHGVKFNEIIPEKPYYMLNICDRSIPPDFCFLLSKFLRRGRRQLKNDRKAVKRSKGT